MSTLHSLQALLFSFPTPFFAAAFVSQDEVLKLDQPPDLASLLFKSVLEPFDISCEEFQDYWNTEIEAVHQNTRDFLQLRSQSNYLISGKPIIESKFTDSPDAFKQKTFQNVLKDVLSKVGLPNNKVTTLSSVLAEVEKIYFDQSLAYESYRVRNASGGHLWFRSYWESVIHFCSEYKLKLGIVVDSLHPELFRERFENLLKDGLLFPSEIVISSEVGVSKPDFRLFSHCLNCLGVMAENCVGIGATYDYDCLGLLYTRVRVINLRSPTLEFIEKADFVGDTDARTKVTFDCKILIENPYSDGLLLKVSVT